MSQRVLVFCALLGAMILWASTFVLVKLIQDFMAPPVVIFFRLFVGSLFFIVYFFIQHTINKQLFRYVAGTWPLLLLLIIFEPCLYFLFEGYALIYTSAAQSGMIVATLPLFVAVGAWFFFKERLHGFVWFGFVLAISGVIALTLLSPTTDVAKNPLLGNTLEVLAMLCATGFSLSSKRLSTSYSPLVITAVQVFGGTLFFFPALFLPSMGIPTAMPLAYWFWLVYLGLFVSVLAYALYNFALAHAKAGQVVAMSNLIPLITLLLSYLFLNDTLTMHQVLAICLVFAGVLLSQYTPKKETRLAST